MVVQCRLVNGTEFLLKWMVTTTAKDGEFLSDTQQLSAIHGTAISDNTTNLLCIKYFE